MTAGSPRPDAGSTTSGAPDLVIIAGRAWIGIPGAPPADGVAIAGGRVAAVGRAHELRRAAGPRTRIIEEPSALVVPGFQDAHVHPSHGGLHLTRCDLHDLRGVEALVRRVREYADANPDLPWILGGGWYMADFPNGTPARGLLDAIVPDRPVYLTNRDEHGAWVNTRALEILGIDRDTPDPADGRIEREADGTPQGTLHEGASYSARERIPAPTDAQRDRALLAAQAYLHERGITAWQDAWVTPPDLAAYRRLASDGRLTGRVRASLWWDRHRGLEQIEGFIEQRAIGRVGRLNAGTVKIMEDGVLENYTGALLEPYLDADGRSTENRGLAFVEPPLLTNAVVRLDAEGFQVHVHAIGDRAVRQALDAFEAARSANGPRGNRHHIAHIQVVHPTDIPRFAALDVTANMQPLWACHDGQMDELTIPFLGPERAGWQYPFRSLERAGARLAGGSDWSVSTPNVFDEVQVAVTRSCGEAGTDSTPLLPDEALGLEAALRAFTSGSAYVNHLDAETGTIEVGKLADLAIVDRDVFSIDPATLGRTRVLVTLVEGVPVHAAPGHGW